MENLILRTNISFIALVQLILARPKQSYLRPKYNNYVYLYINIYTYIGKYIFFIVDLFTGVMSMRTLCTCLHVCVIIT